LTFGSFRSGDDSLLRGIFPTTFGFGEDVAFGTDAAASFFGRQVDLIWSSVS
jgi:hypothetical protein